ncbi:MAG TPA: SsrA-binding protein SmpB [Candidatus Acidoferrales bacterium]|nr:SsrA-binding protein SmpB [Candidatus Acidoferrales bacterium]
MTASHESSDRLIAQNRRASHDYAVLETVEAGLVLSGTEVKSLRGGKASLAEAWASIDNGEIWVRQMHIPPYEQGNRWNLDPVRPRKLLLHRTEIEKLGRAVTQQGLTLIPLRLYFSKGRAKLLLALAKGRKTHDKRAAIAERDARREIDRVRRRGERE